MDSTIAFEEVGHSGGAYELLSEYCIGDVVEKEDESCLENKRCEKSNIFFFGVSGAIILLATYFYFN